jgi:predicted nucleic acid-binding protein
MGMALLHEYESVLSRRAVVSRCPLTVRERETLLDSFLAVCDWVRISFLWRPNLPDEADNHPVELAVAGWASAIVANNVRDLRRGELLFSSVQVLTPARFLKSRGAEP